MFDNISQGLVTTGVAGLYILAPVIRCLATLLMAVSTYRLLKARQDNHKFRWIAAIVLSPIIARAAYEVYRRWIAKKDTQAVKGSTTLFVVSVIMFVISTVLAAVSVVSIGAGYIKSEIDGEPLAVFYDAQGNGYDDYYEVPLYDLAGNTYTYQSAWFTVGTYLDQNGKSYDGNDCYLSEDGYLYYYPNEALKPYQGYHDYYTDGETIYYRLFDQVYWEADGSIYAVSGRRHIELFDFG